MPIVVVCQSCQARFQVSEKFAGKQGPCPKCKAVITIPKAEEQVKIHEPEEFTSGGKTAARDTKGRPVLKPITREEAQLPAVAIVGIVGAVLMCVVVAWMLGRGADKPDDLSTVVLGVGAALLAPPLVFGGYTFLRNQELEPYRGVPLMVRVAICSAVYAALWGGIYSIKLYLLPSTGADDTWRYLFLAGPPMVLGALTALATLDLDFGSGFLHYCLYLLACVLLRLLMQLPPL